MARVRQERAEATRNAILDGAAAAFDSRGFGSTSLNDIVYHAGVTKGALYFHFQSKESLAEALMREQFFTVDPEADLHDPLQAAIDLSHRLAHALRTNARVRAGIRLVLEMGLRSAADAGFYDEWIELLRDALTRGQDRGDVTAETDPGEVATYLVGAFTGVQITSQARTGRADLHDRVTDMWRLVLPGITPPPRLSRFDPAGSTELWAALEEELSDTQPVF